MTTTTVYYTKRFDSGILKGLSANCHCTFPDAATSARFAARVRIGATGRDAITGTRWTVVDCAFQNYQR